MYMNENGVSSDYGRPLPCMILEEALQKLAAGLVKKRCLKKYDKSCRLG
jgi:hypothetical protein